MASLYQRHNSIASIGLMSCCGHVLLFLRLYSNMRLLSASWPCMASIHQRHTSLALVLFLWCVYGNNKSCISRFFPVIRLKLFLTCLLKPMKENSTVLMLTNLKRVLVRCDIAMVDLMRMSSIRSKYVDLMCMQM